MTADARSVFASCFASLLEDSGLQAKQIVARANARRPQGAQWSVTTGLLSAWKTGRNLPSEANQDGFFWVMRVLTEHARGRAARGHVVERLLDEVGWTRLLKEARVASPLDASHRTETALYLRTLIGWVNSDPWPGWFDGPALTPAAIERKLRIASDDDRGRELDADELARRCARLVVLGAPGSGKTWLARRAVRLCAEAALSKLAAGDSLDEVELPVYTTCARLASTYVGDDIRRAVVSSALGQLPDLGGVRVTAALRELFEERNAPTLLVLDSLDEASGVDERIRQADTLPAAWRIVLTSRPGSWSNQLAIPGDDTSRRIGVLRPLSYPDDVESFIDRWFSTRPTWAADIKAQLRNRPALRQAATVPLILAFYCIISDGQPLPDRRAELYTKVIRRMLTGWWRSGSIRDLDFDTCLRTLRSWAWSAAANDPVSGLGSWTEEFWTPRPRQSSEDRESLDHVAVPLGSADPDTGMTLRRFVHRSVQEHLVAEHVAFTMSAEQAATELLNHLWYDPDWEYTAPEVLAMHPDRDQVLNKLICQTTGRGQLSLNLAEIDGCWEVRRFLARVAQASGERDWSPEAAEVIGQAQLDLLNSRSGSILQVVAAGWPTANRRILESVLRLLTSEASDDAAADWIAANNRQRVVDEDDLFLVDLPTDNSPEQPSSSLAKAIVSLAVTEEDRARALKALLSQLTNWTFPGPSKVDLWFTEAVIKLAVTDEDRAQVRGPLLNLLANHTAPTTPVTLALAIADLDPTSEEKAHLRETLVGLLADNTDQFIGLQLANVLTKLAVTDEDRAQVRGPLLNLLANHTAPTTAGTLALAIADLDPTSEEKAHLRETLVGLLADNTNQSIVLQLANVVIKLGWTDEDRAQAGEALSLVIRHADNLTVERLAADIAELGLVATDLTRETLLRMLANETGLQRAVHLAEAVARLAGKHDDWAQAWQTLLNKVIGHNDPLAAVWLTEPVTRLAVTDADRDQAREALLRLLTGKTGPWTLHDLSNTGAQLDLTEDESEIRQVRDWFVKHLKGKTEVKSAQELANVIAHVTPKANEDRARIRETLLKLLAGITSPWTPEELADVAVPPPPLLEALVRAREELLRLLPGESDPLAGCIFALAFLRMSPTTGDLACARECLLNMLANQTESSGASRLAGIFTQLDPSPDDLARAREALLSLLADQTDPLTLCDLADEVAQLDPSPADLARARNALLDLLTNRADPAEPLARTLARLDPSPDDLARARKALLSNQTDPSKTDYLAFVVATYLHPTIADLTRPETRPYLPTESLLAAVRQNSPLTDWLAALPILSDPIQQPGLYSLRPQTLACPHHSRDARAGNRRPV
jgi:hypothetical protein